MNKNVLGSACNSWGLRATKCLYKAKNLSLTIVFTGIIRSTDPRETLTFLQSAKDQDCLHGPHQRSPILFGVDVLSGCTLRPDVLHSAKHISAYLYNYFTANEMCHNDLQCVLSHCRLEEAANCSLVSQVLLGVLRGQNYPQYVANFGSSPPNNPVDWVPISNNSKLEVSTFENKLCMPLGAEEARRFWQH